MQKMKRRLRAMDATMREYIQPPAALKKREAQDTGEVYLFSIGPDHNILLFIYGNVSFVCWQKSTWKKASTQILKANMLGPE